MCVSELKMAGEHVFDSWEDFEESGELDRQLNHFSPGSDKTQSSSPALMKEDSHRTAYQPQLRILKRPTAAPNFEKTNASEKSAQPKAIKTLEEREAAYAEARLRILGPDANSTTNDTPKPLARNSSQGSLKSSSSNNSLTGLESGMERLRTQPSNVVRQPKGPDGSVGFSQKSAAT